MARDRQQVLADMKEAADEAVRATARLTHLMGELEHGHAVPTGDDDLESCANDVDNALDDLRFVRKVIEETISRDAEEG